ncbi:MAG: hypothetical protein GVY26_10940, partial [Bacteroidetes bacterium]|nr:hypothetical protein [Bacteroidota bacterium]
MRKLFWVACCLSCVLVAHGRAEPDTATILYSLSEIQVKRLGEKARLLPARSVPDDAGALYEQWPSDSAASFTAQMGSSYWARLEISSGRADTLLLSQGSPEWGGFERVKGYVFQGDSLYSELETGKRSGIAQASPFLFELPIRKGENTLLLKLESWQPGILLVEAPEELPLFELEAYPEEIRASPAHLLWTGAFYGAILMQIFFFGASFLISREPISLYYALTFGGFAVYLFFELHAHLLFPNWEVPFYLFSITGGFLSSSFLLVFAHAFLRLGSEVGRLVHGYLVLRAIVFGLALLVLYGGQQPYNAASLDKAGSYLGAALLGYMIYQAVRRSTLPKYYFVSLAVIVLVMLGSAVAVFGLQPDLDLAFVNTFMAMALLPLGLFALATGYRVYTIKQEKQRAEQLRRAEQQRRSIYADIAHEFRDPLTLILGHAEEKSIIGRQAGELLELSEQILAFEATDTAQEPVEPVFSDFKVLLRDIAASHGSSYGAHELTLELPEEEVVLYFDPSIVRRIINNLLSNAAKYSGENDPIVLQLAKNRDEPLVELRVSDYGTGIPEQDQAHIFDRFFRGQNAISRRGTGIGLSFAK